MKRARKNFSVMTYGNKTIPTDLSIMLTVHNHQDSVDVVLWGITNNISRNAELIILFDNCVDFSLQRVQQQIPIILGKVVRTVIVESKSDAFETLAEEYMWGLARSRYRLIIQCDMCIMERGFDQKLINILEKFPDLFAVGLRGGHSFAKARKISFAHYSTEIIFGNPLIWAIKVVIKQLFTRRAVNQRVHSGSDSAKFVGHDEGDCTSVGFISSLPSLKAADSFPYDDLQKFVYYVDSIMRGPIIYDSGRMQSFGFLNSDAFFQGLDDHDLNIRAMSDDGLRCCFFPIRCVDIGDSVRNRKRSLMQIFRILFTARSKRKAFLESALRSADWVEKHDSRVIARRL